MPRITRSPPQNESLQCTMSDSDVNKIAASSAPIFQSQRKRQRVSSEEDLQTFKAEIKDMLEGWRNSQNMLLNTLLAEVADIKKQNGQIKQSNEDIEKSLEFLSKQYEEMKTKVKELETERKEHLKQIASLENKYENIERNAKMATIEIRGVPQNNKPETKTDLFHIVQNTCKAINVHVPRDAVRDVYRVNQKFGKPIIIADLTSVILKNEVIHGVKQFNKGNDTQRLSTRIIGLNDINDPIYVSEALTAKTRKLFYLTREYAKNNNYRFCWTSNGRIYLRKTTESRHIEIKEELQLHSLKDTK